MRTYGRINSGGTLVWQEVDTDASGNNDLVYLTTLAQTLKMNLGESPFFANYGIPARESVIQQIFPDYYVSITQQQFAPYFASLLVARTSTNPPTYRVNVTTHQGVKLNASIPVPT